MNRNYEKELLFYQQELAAILSEKIAIQAMLSDTIAERDQLKNQLESLAPNKNVEPKADMEHEAIVPE